ncbi:4'-phosphopantetheinyl transferase family protein [Shewanella olleyana]|uniref:4'-phosphopantetheinyl transferase family protein n=1 Tax=Shewanella olleyana TaxID=135626 RepID=UPI0024B28589|nr:4'-phosphopantetheinyl transferase superfamily protein [Shewanella olleyana]
MKSPTAIQLFFCPLNTDLLDESTASIVRSWLPEDEVKKVDRFIQQSSRDQGLMVRGYLRSVLSRFASVEPQQWQFEYGEKGKPRLTAEQFAETGLQFNLSHSGDWLLIGVANTYGTAQQHTEIELGVDIERRRETTNIHSILNHYFSKPEESALLALTEDKHRERFFDLWALKESYIKAKGLGLALSLKSFAFDLSAASLGELQVNDETITIQQGVPLSLLKASDSDGLLEDFVIAPQWHCYLGKLDDLYRFAVSIGGASSFLDELPPELKAKKISWLEVVNHAFKPTDR